MFCGNCGKEVSEKAVACPGCGLTPRAEKKYCYNCASVTDPRQVVCLKCGVSLSTVTSSGSDTAKNQLTYILLGVFFGQLGIHNFYAGYKKNAITQLLITVCTCGFGFWISWIWAIIDIINIKKDAEGVPFSK